MRVTDLMVGDLVSVSGKSVKITKDDLATMLIFLDDDSKINPIPLTEEILVKNGFHKVPPHQLGRHTTYDLFKFKTNFMLTRKDEGNIIYDRNITVTYVHQLQHLLRLCGIEKEIEL